MGENRTTVYKYDADGGREVAGHFLRSKATVYLEDNDWDGSNHISVNTRSAFAHETLYRTGAGQWVLHEWSNYENVADRWSFISRKAAHDWMLLNDEGEAAELYFGPEAYEDTPALRAAVANYLRARAEQVMKDEELPVRFRNERRRSLLAEAGLLDGQSGEPADTEAADA